MIVNFIIRIQFKKTSKKIFKISKALDNPKAPSEDVGRFARKIHRTQFERKVVKIFRVIQNARMLEKDLENSE